MADRLTEKIKHTLIINNIPGDIDHLADELVTTFRRHRMSLPVKRTADQRIEAEICQQGQRIRARKRPSLAFLATLGRRP